MSPPKRQGCAPGLHVTIFATAMVLFVAPRAAQPATATDAAITDMEIEQTIVGLGATLDARAETALKRMDGLGRRLLALRSYLRNRGELAHRWSWTDEQIRAYEGSAEQCELQQEIERVRAAFNAANPGYEVWVNPQVRSFDTQLHNWNRNASVESAGDRLLLDLKTHLSTPGFTQRSAAGTRAAVIKFLQAYSPSPVPTLAAPGLSPHGQMRAVDFQVLQGDKVIAGPSAASIPTDWDAAGWATRLEGAVRTASHRFVGPLKSPREPWHYTFTP